MNYYKRHIGDYHKKAGRLTMLQHGAYTLLIDSCYDRERFPTLEDAYEWCWAFSDAEKEAVRFVLARFWVERAGIFYQPRIEEELDKYQDNSTTNKKIALEREARKRTNRANACTNEHLTTNHKPLTKKPNNTGRGSRLPTDWLLPKAWGEWALKEAEGITPEAIRKCSERFRDYWIGVSGSKALKADWEATWRNWVRKEIDYGTLVIQKEKNQSAAPWWTSDASIIAKGKELGLEPRPGESMNEFKGRIQVKIGGDK